MRCISPAQTVRPEEDAGSSRHPQGFSPGLWRALDKGRSPLHRASRAFGLMCATGLVSAGVALANATTNELKGLKFMKSSRCPSSNSGGLHPREEQLDDEREETVCFRQPLRSSPPRPQHVATATRVSRCARPFVYADKVTLRRSRA